MGLHSVAREIYLVAKDDNHLAAKIRTERASLADSIATDSDAAFELTSATVNGQTYGGQRSMTKIQRLTMLGQVVKMLDLNMAASSDGKASFSSYGDS